MSSCIATSSSSTNQQHSALSSTDTNVGEAKKKREQQQESKPKKRKRRTDDYVATVDEAMTVKTVPLLPPSKRIKLEAIGADETHPPPFPTAPAIAAATKPKQQQASPCISAVKVELHATARSPPSTPVSKVADVNIGGDSRGEVVTCIRVNSSSSREKTPTPQKAKKSMTRPPPLERQKKAITTNDDESTKV